MEQLLVFLLLFSFLQLQVTAKVSFTPWQVEMKALFEYRKSCWRDDWEDYISDFHSPQTLESMFNGLENRVHKVQRLQEKWKRIEFNPTKADNTQIIHLVEKEFKKDAQFMANAVVSIQTVEKIAREFRLADQWAQTFRALKDIVDGRTRGPQGEVFEVDDKTKDWLRRKSAVIMSFKEGYDVVREIYPRGLHLMKEPRRVVMKDLKYWFPTWNSWDVNQPFDITIYFRALAALDRDDKWWKAKYKEWIKIANDNNAWTGRIGPDSDDDSLSSDHSFDSDVDRLDKSGKSAEDVLRRVRKSDMFDHLMAWLFLNNLNYGLWDLINPGSSDDVKQEDDMIQSLFQDDSFDERVLLGAQDPLRSGQKLGTFVGRLVKNNRHRISDLVGMAFRDQNFKDERIFFQTRSMTKKVLGDIRRAYSRGADLPLQGHGAPRSGMEVEARGPDPMHQGHGAPTGGMEVERHHREEDMNQVQDDNADDIFEEEVSPEDGVIKDDQGWDGLSDIGADEEDDEEGANDQGAESSGDEVPDNFKSNPYKRVNRHQR